MSIEPTTNLDPEQSPPVEETIPLVKAQNPSSEAGDEAFDESSDAAAVDKPLTPAEMDCYECRSCGYTYEPTKGDSRTRTPVGVPFKDLPIDWRCPVCGAGRPQFSNMGPVGTASGFKQNLNYGFGVNTLTPGQKNVLIFGGLGIGILFFLSLYGLQ